MRGGRPWLDQALALENILSALGVAAFAQVFFPGVMGRWAPGPVYAFVVGSGLLMAGSYVRNRKKRPPGDAP